MALVAPDTEARVARALRIAGLASIVLIAAGALMMAYYAPLLPDCDETPSDNCQDSPIGQKIFYVHVPVALAAYVALLALAYSSYRYLARDDEAWDAFAHGAAEVGVLFAALTLFTGILWGHLEWPFFGYWNNDDWKLVLTLVLFLVYAGYLVLRAQVHDTRRRARVAAVYALLGTVTIPLSYVAQRVWASIHPTIFAAPDGEGGIVTPGVEETFVVNALAFVALAVFLMLARFRVEAARRAGGAS